MVEYKDALPSTKKKKSKRLFVPIIPQKTTLPFLNTVNGLAKIFNAELYFYYVTKDNISPEEGRKCLGQYLENYSFTVPIHIAFGNGDIHEMLIEQEKLTRPIITVLAAHQHSFLEKLVVGSVSEKFMVENRNSLLIYKESLKATEKCCLLPIDIYGNNKVTLKVAQGYAKAEEKSLVFLYIIPKSSTAKEERSYQSVLKKYLIKHKVAPPYKAVVKRGNIDHGLASAIEEFKPETVFVTMKRKTLFEKWFQKSIVQYLFHQGQCSLFIYKVK